MQDNAAWRVRFRERWQRAGAEAEALFASSPSVTTPPPPAPDPPWEPERDLRVVIGGDYRTETVVTATPQERREHTLLLGKTGTGKSNLMLWLMWQDMAAGRGFVALDPHGKLIDDVLRLVPPERRDDVIYLDAADEDFPFGLNLFEAPRSVTPVSKARMVSQLLQVFDKCWAGGFSGTAEGVLKSVCQTYLDNRAGTLAAIPKLLTDRDYREAFYPRISDPNTLIEWRRITSSTGKSTGMLKNEEIDPVMRRLNKFVGNPIVRNIMGQEKTTLDFPRWMAEHKIVVIKIPDNDSDGVGKDAAQLLATVILQLILRAAYGREIDSTLYSVYCDEFQHYVTGDIPEMIQNIRKYGVGLFLATQSFSNIKEEAIRTALLGVGTLLCFQLTDPDARIVAGEFRRGVPLDDDWRIEQKRVHQNGAWYVQSERKYHRPTRGEIASRLANLRGLVGAGHCLAKVGGREHVLKIVNMDPLVRAGTGVSRARIVQRSRERYCHPRWEVERELREALWPDTDDAAAREDRAGMVPVVAVALDDAGTGGVFTPGAPAAPPAPPPPARHTRRRRVIAPLPEGEGEGVEGLEPF